MKKKPDEPPAKPSHPDEGLPPYKFQSDILVIDTETSGLDPETHSMIELGACLVDRDTGQIVDEFSQRMPPWAGSLWNEKAEQVHGLSREMLAGEPPAERVIRDFYMWLNGRRIQLAGWNVQFDVGFLKEASKRAGFSDYYRTINYRPWCICTAYEAMYVANVIPDKVSSLDKWCAKFDYVRSEHHSALEDARLTAHALQALMEINGDGTFGRFDEDGVCYKLSWNDAKLLDLALVAVTTFEDGASIRPIREMLRGQAAVQKDRQRRRKTTALAPVEPV